MLKHSSQLRHGANFRGLSHPSAFRPEFAEKRESPPRPPLDKRWLWSENKPFTYSRRVGIESKAMVAPNRVPTRVGVFFFKLRETRPIKQPGDVEHEIARQDDLQARAGSFERC
jgi:hypothetical protein